MSTPSKELLSEVFNTTVKNIELDRGQKQELLNQLEYVGEVLGIDHAISFLESLKNKTVAEQKSNTDLELPF